MGEGESVHHLFTPNFPSTGGSVIFHIESATARQLEITLTYGLPRNRLNDFQH